MYELVVSLIFGFKKYFIVCAPCISFGIGLILYLYFQGSIASGLSQQVDGICNGKVLPHHNQFKVFLPDSNNFSDLESNGRERSVVHTILPKLAFSRSPNEVSGNTDACAFSEKNRGPRAKKSKDQLSLKAYTTKAGISDAQGNIIIYTDQYNKEDFLVDYAAAKFFVIKSYSEDDVHKSIKYGVWSSTSHGNKKLQKAFDDVQRISAGKPRGCPIFLFFSVSPLTTNKLASTSALQLILFFFGQRIILMSYLF